MTTPKQPIFHCDKCGQPVVKSGYTPRADGWRQKWKCIKHRDGTGCGHETVNPKP